MRKFLFSICMLGLLVGGCDDGVKVKDSCGDNFVDPGEACDGNALGGATCLGLGFHDPDGVLACRADCTFDTAGCGGGFCGNGNLEDAETCEGDQLRGATCESLGHYGGTLACGGDCEHDLAGCNGRCGDGTLDGAFGEACDGSDLGGATCLSLGYHGGALACDAACALDTADCELHGRCGDGVIQEGMAELCDGAAVPDTCHGLGAFGGQLTCGPDCTYDRSGCRTVSLLVGRFRHYCVVLDDRGIRCWGADEAGQLGTGTASVTGRFVPVSVALPAGRTTLSVSVGQAFTCAVLDDGRVWCWGDNGLGQLGTGASGGSSAAPVQVALPGGETFVAVTCGNTHGCARAVSGRVWCWGSNDVSQVGPSGLGIVVATPAEVSVPTGTLAAIRAGADHTCLLLQTGQAHCWGANHSGQLGTGDTQYRDTPTQVRQSSLVFTSIYPGDSHTCALDLFDAMHCWGRNDFGQLGTGEAGTNTTGPMSVAMPGTPPVTFGMAGIAVTSCAVDNTRAAWCWGGDFHGALGNGPGADAASPSAVSMPSGVGFLLLASGFYSTCATDLNGGVWCWGLNDQGQLGRDPAQEPNSGIPVRVGAP